MKKLFLIYLVLAIYSCSPKQVDKNSPQEQTKIIEDHQEQFGDLYEDLPTIRIINDYEFAEVLGEMDTIAKSKGSDYLVKIIRVCNGPANPEIEYCNCSHNFYVVTGQYDLPPEFNLFSIGPFYLGKIDGIEIKEGVPVASISHNVKGMNQKIHFKILADRLEIIKNTEPNNS